jgi:hypothetical protein
MQSRFRWSYLWYGSILALGITTGLGARHFAAPLGLLEPGSRDDERILASLDSDIDRLDIVQSLRKQSYSLHSDTALTSAGDVKAQKGWLEVDLKWRETDKGRLLHVMSGTRGFGVQRAFWNAETREMVAVVWLGGGLAGWPGVAHGGAIATIFEETMARMVKGPDGPIGMAAPDCLCHKGRQADIYRTNPSSSVVECNVRKTNIQPRFLRDARIVLETESTADGAAARARVTANKVMVVMAVTRKRPDEENRASAAGSGDHRNTRDCEGRSVCQGQGKFYHCWTLDVRDCVAVRVMVWICQWLAGRSTQDARRLNKTQKTHEMGLVCR